MKEIPVQSWREFQQKVNESESDRDEVQQSRPNGTSAPALLFRGQADSSWHLDTTLERQIRSDLQLPQEAPADFSAKNYLQLIYSLKPEIEIRTGTKWEAAEFQILVQKLRDNLELLPPPMPEFMAYLRHQGFPSPLLDWTASPYVAAYFAFKAVARGVERVSIYVHQRSAGGTGIVGPTIKAHPRHFSQQCWYTFRPKKRSYDNGEWDWVYSSHEAEFGNFQEAMCKITIPASERKTVLKYLDQHNVTSFSLFHSDESLMETLALREFTLRR